MQQIAHRGWRLVSIFGIVVGFLGLLFLSLGSPITPSAQAAPLLTATPSPANTATASVTETVTATNTAEVTPTETVTVTPIATETVTVSETVTPTPAGTITGTPSPEGTEQPTLTSTLPVSHQLWLPSLTYSDTIIENPITDTWDITDIVDITDVVGISVTETPLVTDVVPISDDIDITDTVVVTPSIGITAAPEYTPTIISGTNVFGIELAGTFGAAHVERVAAAGASWTRRTDFNWSEVEPTEGARQWDKMATLEEDLRQASLRGIKVILIVLRTPAWAQKYIGSGCGPIRVDKLGAFANFMRDAVARYSAPPFNVKYWEIWNEPDAPTVKENKGWGCHGNPADTYYGGAEYARLLKNVYPAIKATDANAKVLVGGQLGNCDPVRPPTGMNCRGTRFFEGILRGGGGPFFDGVAFHAYEYYFAGLGKWGNANWWSAYNTTGPVLAVKAHYYKKLLSAYRVTGKFLMDTETALLCSNCAGNANFELTKAYYIPEMYAAGMAEGLQAVSFFGLRSGWLGGDLIDGYNNGLPAYDTFKIATAKLGPATFAGRTVYADVGTTGVMGYKFTLNGRKVWLIRALSSRVVITKFAKLPSRISDPFGKPITPTKTLTLGLMPVYVEWDS